MAKKDSIDNPKEDYLIMFEVLQYIPTHTLQQFIEVLHQGAKHYGKDNWRTPPYLPREEILRSVLRHTKALYDGKVLNDDKEPAVYHAANLMCNAMFLLTGDIEGWWGTDDDVNDLQKEDTREELIRKLTELQRQQSMSQQQSAKPKTETVIVQGNLPRMTARKLNPAPGTRPLVSHPAVPDVPTQQLEDLLESLEYSDNE